jgi:hypothetical protein
LPAIADHCQELPAISDQMGWGIGMCHPRASPRTSDPIFANDIFEIVVFSQYGFGSNMYFLFENQFGGPARPGDSNFR